LKTKLNTIVNQIEGELAREFKESEIKMNRGTRDKLTFSVSGTDPLLPEIKEAVAKYSSYCVYFDLPFNVNKEEG